MPEAPAPSGHEDVEVEPLAWTVAAGSAVVAAAVRSAAAISSARLSSTPRASTSMSAVWSRSPVIPKVTWPQ